jgi:hypothetical protein
MVKWVMFGSISRQIRLLVMLKADEKDFLKDLHFFNEDEANGISFALAMRETTGPAYDYDNHEYVDGDIRIFKRVQQPCYGELRKYKETHGDGCTKPESKRPGDLFWPFPFGTPEALATGFDGMSSRSHMYPMLDYLFSNESPFKKGFISAENIEWSANRSGIVLLHTEFDPTVLVNLLKYIQDRMLNMESVFSSYLDAGLSNLEAFILDYSVRYESYTKTVKANDRYIYPISLDLQGVINQKPNDLTGGTLYDRMDYDRKRMHEVFYKPEEKGGVNFAKLIAGRLGGSEVDMEYRGIKASLEDLVRVFKEIYDEASTKRKKAA